MNEIEIIFCRGIPGSGKTVWAKEWVLKDTTKRIRINNDDLKLMMQPLEFTFNQVLGPLFRKARLAIIKEAIKNGLSVVVDNMNLSITLLKKEAELIKKYCNTYKINCTISVRTFNESLEECIFRDSFRTHPVGEELITSLYKNYKDILNSDETIHL